MPSRTQDGVILDASTWYLDADGDGYGDSSSTTTACDQPGGFIGDATDYDDVSVNPGATEAWYDGADQDCDGWSDYGRIDGNGTAGTRPEGADARRRGPLRPPVRRVV